MSKEQFNQYIEKYNEFFEQLVNMFESNENINSYLQSIQSESDDQKWQRGVNLSEALKTETLFNHFLKSKIKLFSSKNKDTLVVSTSFFCNILPLKKLSTIKELK